MIIIHNLENQYYRVLRIESKLIGKLLDRKEIFNFRCKLDGLKYSHGLKENYYINPLSDIFRNLISNKCFHLDTLNQFYDKINQYISSIKNKKLIKYTLIFPVKIKFIERFPHSFLSYKKKPYFTLKSFRDLNVNYFTQIYEYTNENYDERYLLNNEREEKELIQNSINSNYLYFIGDIYARNITYAVKQISRDIEINLGIYIYVIQGYHTIERWGGDPFEKSISELILPLVFVFEDKSLEKILYSTYRIPEEYKLSLKNIEIIEDIINDLNKIKNRKLKKLIFNAFEKYYSALKESKYSACFIQLWNVIELLLLNNPELKEKEIIKRLKSIFREGWELKKDYDEMIDLIYQKRNLLVHESEDKITEVDRNFIKRLVDVLLEVSINICLKVKNIQTLEFYYQNLRKPVRILKQEKEILDELINDKST